MSEFYSFVTATGLAKIATLPTGGTIRLTHMAFGNSTLEPTEDQTSLHSEQHRCELNKVAVDSSTPNILAVEALVESDVGGFWIREIGVYDSDGDLFAIGKYPATYKPLDTEGTVKELGVRMILRVSNADTVMVSYNKGIIDGAANTNLDNLTFDGQKKFDDKANLDLGNLNAAGQEKLDKKASTDLDNLTEVGQQKLDDKASVDLDNLTPAAQQKFDIKANTDLNNLSSAGQQKFDAKADLNSPTFSGTPSAPTPAAGTNTGQLATTAFVTAAVSLAIETLMGSAPEALDTLQELATALGNDENFATTISTQLANKANKTGDTVTVADASPTTAFTSRNIKAQTTDPGAGSALATGRVLLVYE